MNILKSINEEQRIGFIKNPRFNEAKVIHFVNCINKGNQRVDKQ
jgi:hypothetical protein